MLKVGLTGGIACGKSYVLREFEKLGVYAVDADRIAHGVILRGQPAYLEILERFGSSIQAADGEIDRKKLGQIIFSDPSARLALNAIVHPYVWEQQDRLFKRLEGELDALQTQIVMVDAALMIETRSWQRYDTLVVVYCRRDIQVRRLMERDWIDKAEAEKRVDSQLPAIEKVKHADYVIETSGKRSDTLKQVRDTFAQLTARVTMTG